MQTADCRPDTKCRLGTKCRLQSGYKMQTENLKSFFVWYVITCHLTTYRASRNRFSAISFHDYLHYCGIFLARFLIKIDLNIISSLRIVFSLCARVGLCDVCTDFTNLIKVDVDVDVMCKIRETINSFARGPYYYLFKRYVFILLTKMRTKAKIVPSTWYIFNASRSHHINLPPWIIHSR